MHGFDLIFHIFVWQNHTLPVSQWIRQALLDIHSQNCSIRTFIIMVCGNLRLIWWSIHKIYNIMRPKLCSINCKVVLWTWSVYEIFIYTSSRVEAQIMIFFRKIWRHVKVRTTIPFIARHGSSLMAMPFDRKLRFPLSVIANVFTTYWIGLRCISSSYEEHIMPNIFNLVNRSATVPEFYTVYMFMLRLQSIFHTNLVPYWTIYDWVTAMGALFAQTSLWTAEPCIVFKKFSHYHVYSTTTFIFASWLLSNMVSFLVSYWCAISTSWYISCSQLTTPMLIP